MVTTIVECAPNISEGIDTEKIELIVQAARNISGCAVLGVEPDADYNRMMLHSEALSLTHPSSGEHVEFRASAAF